VPDSTETPLIFKLSTPTSKRGAG